MTKKLLGLIICVFFAGSLSSNAQDMYRPETNNMELISTPTSFSEKSLAYRRPRWGRNDNKFAIGLSMPFNTARLGVGLSFQYNFTRVLRFYLGGEYFFHAAADRHFKTITPSGETGDEYYGWHWSVNPNLNFVFGDGNFHFYLITGLYFAYGYSEVVNALSELSSDLSYWSSGADKDYMIINGEVHYKTDKLTPMVGLGVNLGFGIEYQFTDEFRMFLDQRLSLGLMTTWVASFGAAYCF